MKKFRVHGTAYASWVIGEFEANSAEEAAEMAADHENNETPQLCWSCNDSLELGDALDINVDNISEVED